MWTAACTRGPDDGQGQSGEERECTCAPANWCWRPSTANTLLWAIHSMMLQATAHCGHSTASFFCCLFCVRFWVIHCRAITGLGMPHFSMGVQGLEAALCTRYGHPGWFFWGIFPRRWWVWWDGHSSVWCHDDFFGCGVQWHYFVALQWGSGLESTLCPLHQRLFVASCNFVPDCHHHLQQLCWCCYIHSTGLPALLNHPWQLVDLQGFLCTHSGKPPFGPMEANGFNRGCRTMAKTAPNQEEFSSLKHLFCSLS